MKETDRHKNRHKNAKPGRQGMTGWSGDMVDCIPAGKNAIRTKTGRADHDRSLMLARVDAALERLEAGTFGLCLGCNGQIAIGRLQDDPSTAYCADCYHVYER